MASVITIDGKEILTKVIVGGICSLILAFSVAVYSHYTDTKEHTVLLQHVRQSGWASCQLAYEQAKKSTAPCYPEGWPVPASSK